jgi:hypothetical protein
VQKQQKHIQSFLQPQQKQQQQRVGFFQTSTPIRQYSQSAKKSPLESQPNSSLHTPQPSGTTNPNIRQPSLSVRQSQTVDSPQQSTTTGPNIQQQLQSARQSLLQAQSVDDSPLNTPQQQQVRLQPSTTSSPSIKQQSESSSLLVKRLLVQCRRRQPGKPTVPMLKQPALPDNQQQQVQDSEPQPSTSAEPQPSTSAEPQPSTLAEPQPSTSASGCAPRNSIQMLVPNLSASSSAGVVNRFIFKRSHQTLLDENLAVPLPSIPSSDPFDFDDLDM